MRKCLSVGGQALIEGIMMKSPLKTVIAVRNKNSEIETIDFNTNSVKDRCKFLALPIIRGAVNFVESLITGYKALMIAADKSGLTDLEDENEPEEASEEPKKISGVIMGVILTIAGVLGVFLAVVLFMYLPAKAFNLLNGLCGGKISYLRALTEGILKIIIFVTYIVLVSKTKDIKRVFMYHGAEHKTIFCYENGLMLTPENVKKQSRFHPRCGTSFMFLMLFVGILISFILQTVFPGVTKIMWLWVTIKILILPLVCGIGYELIKYCGKHDNLLIKIISAPGLWMQRITTKEPDISMCEVGIASLLAVLPKEEAESLTPNITKDPEQEQQ